VTTSVLVYISLVNVMFSETACEVLFERDADDTSVATIILESLIKVNVHLLIDTNQIAFLYVLL